MVVDTLFVNENRENNDKRKRARQEIKEKKVRKVWCYRGILLMICAATPLGIPSTLRSSLLIPSKLPPLQSSKASSHQILPQTHHTRPAPDQDIFEREKKAKNLLLLLLSNLVFVLFSLLFLLNLVFLGANR